MSALIRDVTYALRTFRSARVFAATAVLTLALGIGGTTAIFTLMHAVMLKSLPVADPSRLYRIGDGDNCCVMGGPQGRWGFYSFPLFEYIKAETPQFEDITAFSTFVGRMSVRRQGVAEAPRPLRTMYATGGYFTTLGVGAFTGRVFTAADDRAAAEPVAVMSYNAWQNLYGGDPSVVGSTLMIEGHAFTVSGIAPPGFFGETLRADPPDLWLPLQQEPLITGADTSLLRQPDFGMAPRHRTAACGCDDRRHGCAAHCVPPAVDAEGCRIPRELDAGNRAPDVRADDHRRAGGCRCRRDERAVRAQPADSPGGVRDGAAHRVRERRQSTAGARGGAARPDRRASGSRCVTYTDRRSRR